jgi:HEAT repeat protein
MSVEGFGRNRKKKERIKKGRFSSVRTHIMKRLSSETYKLIQQLYQSPNFFERVSVEQERLAPILESIEKSSEPMAIPNLLSYVIANNKKNRVAVARTMDNMINQIPVSDLVNMDEYIRVRDLYYSYIVGWNEIKPDDIKDLDHLQVYKASVLGVTSFHNNGFVREKAINELNNIWTGKELPYLLIRLNDWVPNVQQAALTAVKARLQSAYASHFVNCLPLIMRLSKRNRIDQNPIINSIKEILQDESSLSALNAGLKSQNCYIRRFCFQIAFDAIAMDLTKIIELGSKDSDYTIRFLSVHKIRMLTENAKIEQLLQIFRTDSYVPIRREFLRIYAEKFSEQASEELKQALLDSNWLIRYEARFQIAKNDSMDFASFYRNTIVKGHAIYSAISGLEETGDASDDILILPFINHPQTRIRRVSIRALAKLNPKVHADLFMQALFDPCASVSREAARALERSGSSLTPRNLWNDLVNATQEHVKANLLFFIARLPKWESIYYLIKAASSEDKFTSNLAYQKINYWLSHFNNSFVVPTVLQKADLLNLLAECEEHFDQSMRKEIEYILKTR